MKLEKLATKISKIYMLNPKVEGVLLGGSVARGWHDEYSDIELFVFWKENPTEEDRKAVIQYVNGKIIDFHPYEEEEWSETYITQGVKLEISSFLTTTIEKVIKDVTETYDTDLDKQCLVATIHDGVMLSGEEIITTIKKKVETYPEGLREAMIRENFDFGNRWNNREALLAREDWLMLYSVMVGIQSNLMGILFGLNRLYVHHPAFKWQKRSLKKMNIVPENIANQLSSILLERPKHGVSELEEIINELYQLVKGELLTMDLSAAIEKSHFLRPKAN